ncbi:hypothetical protein [Spirillospora albida]|uniref:hypothetical protein n=1 Tax=Spirillospora albida TaxID=58123 RepID=UPI0004BFC1DE|nr:hypothetical protein [Spirillospora albida]
MSVALLIAAVITFCAVIPAVVIICWVRSVQSAAYRQTFHGVAGDPTAHGSGYNTSPSTYHHNSGGGPYMHDHGGYTGGDAWYGDHSSSDSGHSSSSDSSSSSSSDSSSSSSSSDSSSSSW